MVEQQQQLVAQLKAAVAASSPARHPRGAEPERPCARAGGGKNGPSSLRPPLLLLFLLSNREPPVLSLALPPLPLPPLSCSLLFPLLAAGRLLACSLMYISRSLSLPPSRHLCLSVSLRGTPRGPEGLQVWSCNSAGESCRTSPATPPGRVAGISRLRVLVLLLPFLDYGVYDEHLHEV